MADAIFVPGGGTEIPFDPQNLEAKLMFFQVAHRDIAFQYLNDRWPLALAGIVTQVLLDRSPIIWRCAIFPQPIANGSSHS